MTHLSFNISEWSAVRNGPQARHYQNVANRRAKLASIEEQTRLSNLASAMSFPAFATPMSPAEASEPCSSEISNHTSSIHNLAEAPVSPLEDPDLVGHAAATAARERRLYMTQCIQERGALKQESRGWDFMLSQMSDWHERERSWDSFKQNVEQKKTLGNRFLRRLMPF